MVGRKKAKERQDDRPRQGDKWLQTLVDCGLLGRVWPGERVFPGRLVCKVLYNELLAVADEVDFPVAAYAQPAALNAFSDALSRALARGARISVRCRGRSQAKAFFGGIDIARDLLNKDCHIVRLEIKGGGLKATNINSIIPSLHERPALRHLDLGDCSLKHAELEALAPGLQSCTLLQFLCLSNNDVGDAGASVLARALSGCHMLHRLDLRRARIKDAGSEQLAALVRATTALQFLDLGANLITATGVGKLASGLAQCTAIETLSLGGNSAADPAGVLARSLSGMRRLQSLDLSDAKIDPQGAARFAPALAVPCLGKLNLSGNALRGLGADFLVHSSPSLHTVYMDGAQVGEDGAAKIASALPACRALKVLSLRRNAIRARGAEDLVAALGRCGGIQELELGDNMIGGPGAALLAAALRASPPPRCFRHLGLSGNGIQRAGMEQLAAAEDTLDLEAHVGGGRLVRV